MTFRLYVYPENKPVDLSHKQGHSVPLKIYINDASFSKLKFKDQLV